MNPSLKTAPKKDRNIPLKKIIAVILLLALCGAGYTAYQVHANNVKKQETLQADKARFALVERDMALASKAMDAVQNGQTSSKSQKSCSRTAQKYSEDSLRCSVIHEVQFSNISIEKMKSSTLKMENALADVGFKKYDTTSSSLNLELIAKNQDIDERLSTNTPSTCNLNIKYQSSAITSDVNKNGEGVFTLRCRDSVSQPIYPLAE